MRRETCCIGSHRRGRGLTPFVQDDEWAAVAVTHTRTEWNTDTKTCVSACVCVCVRALSSTSYRERMRSSEALCTTC